MASIETRANDCRVVWREAGAKQAELFANQLQAQEFKGLVEAHGNRWPFGWVKGHGFVKRPTEAPTFGDWAVRCIDARATANDRTRHDYHRDLRTHLLPTFDRTPVDQITAEMVGAWLIAVSAGSTTAPQIVDGKPVAKKPTAKTVKNVHALASSIMADAISAQLCGVNPFKGRMRAQSAVKQEEMTFLTLDEFERLLPLISVHYRPLVLCLAHTGLRWSEATALRVGDIDLLDRRLTVVRAWKRTPENFYEIGEPKSRRSRRTLRISNRLALDLAPLLEGKRSTDYVFTSAQGHPIRHSNFRLRTWTKAVEVFAEDVGKAPRIHDLRHSHASWLIAAKVSLPAIQRRLGHESITTTVDRYGHLMPDVDDEIGAAIDRWVATPDVAGLSEMVPQT